MNSSTLPLKVFLNQATQVNAWDRMMVNNGEKIVSLNESVEKVKLDQQVSHNYFKYSNPALLDNFVIPFAVHSSPTLIGNTVLLPSYRPMFS